MKLIIRTPLAVYETVDLSKEDIEQAKIVIKSPSTWVSLITKQGEIILLENVIKNTVFEFVQ